MWKKELVNQKAQGWVEINEKSGWDTGKECCRAQHLWCKFPANSLMGLLQLFIFTDHIHMDVYSPRNPGRVFVATSQTNCCMLTEGRSSGGSWRVCILGLHAPTQRCIVYIHCNLLPAVTLRFVRHTYVDAPSHCLYLLYSTYLVKCAWKSFCVKCCVWIMIL